MYFVVFSETFYVRQAQPESKTDLSSIELRATHFCLL